MTEASREELIEQIQILDGRIDELTKPLPSRELRRLAEALFSSDTGDYEAPGTFGPSDYANLLMLQDAIRSQLPAVMKYIRGHSICGETGWRFSVVENGYGRNDTCAICRDPFQHFGHTVEVHCIDMHSGAFRGVCRPCVGEFSPLEFSDRPEVDEWLGENRRTCEPVESDHATEERRVDLLDAIRRHALRTHYPNEIMNAAEKWTANMHTEWR